MLRYCHILEEVKTNILLLSIKLRNLYKTKSIDEAN